MKKNIKKLITATICSAVSLTAIGCSTTNAKLAKNIDNSMADFVSSINSLDYVATAKAATPTQNKNYGKIVETAAGTTDNKISLSAKNSNIELINNKINELEIENTITRPDERTNDFKLFVLSDSPFVALTSEDNNFALNVALKFSTDKIEETSDEIDQKINTLILKRSILMIYVNEIYNNNVNFSADDKVAINAYVNVIKENTSYLNGNRGMVKNQLGLASDLVSKDSNGNLVNYYIIKSGEALETRASKIDSAISAIDSIIKIIESSLTDTSSYFNSNLSGTYNDLLSSFDKVTSAPTEITQNSTNQEIASSISNSLGLLKNIENPNVSSPEQNLTTPRVDNNIINAPNQTNTNPAINKIANPAQNNTVTLPENLMQSQSKNNMVQNQKSTQNNINLSQNNASNNENLRSKSENNENLQNQTNSTAPNTRLLNNNTNMQQNSNGYPMQNGYINKTNNSSLKNSSETNSQRPVSQRNYQNNSRIRYDSNKTNSDSVRRRRMMNNSSRTNPSIRTNPDISKPSFKPDDVGFDRGVPSSTQRKTISNSAKSVSNMNGENEKIMRADRTPNKEVVEEYTAPSTQANDRSVNHANTMPFVTKD